MANLTGKYTPERVDRLLTAIRAGNTRRAASAYAGIDQDTLLNWIHRHSEFSEQMQKAEADAEIMMAGVIRKAAVGGEVVKETVVTTRSADGTTTTETKREVARPEWTAAAWFLERRNPNEWGRKDRVDMVLDIRAQVLELSAQLGIDPADILREAKVIALEERSNDNGAS